MHGRLKKLADGFSWVVCGMCIITAIRYLREKNYEAAIFGIVLAIFNASLPLGWWR
jgi:hypothetical protein